MDPFQAALLHDLRSQVGSILLNARMLCEDLASPDGPAMVADLLTAAQTAQVLVQRMGDGLRHEVVGLSAVVTEACGSVAQARVTVLGAEAPVRGDALAIRQIVSNLVSNAGEAGSSRIEVSIDGRRVRVADNGPGLADHVCQALFERPVSTRGLGRGQGLLCARHLARQMGGDLQVIAVPSGACFELSLHA